tara:strand:+ start:547 stop:774 length:228 start_codon:yes stop_codon:yes gene_type:complete
MRNNSDDLSNQLVDKIKKWLKKETKSYKDIQKRIDGGEHWENVCDEPQIFYGRNECAEGLLDQIKLWEKKLYGND